MTKKRRQPNQKLLYSTVSVTIVSVALLFGYYFFLTPKAETWQATLVDQLSIEPSFANLTRYFNETLTSMLSNSGYDVKYYPGKDVTVNFYRDLPSKGGKITVLRVHSTVRTNSSFVDLFTSEEFKDGEHVELYGQLSRAKFLVGSKEYFAIGPTFVNQTMSGRFDDSIIILMGCRSLETESMAKALIGKGAKVVVGWDDWIDIIRTDNATIFLLTKLLEDEPIITAIEKTNIKYPPTSRLDIGRLKYYPLSAANYTIEKPPKTEAYIENVKVSYALTSIHVVGLFTTRTSFGLSTTRNVLKRLSKAVSQAIPMETFCKLKKLPQLPCEPCISYIMLVYNH